MRLLPFALLSCAASLFAQSHDPFPIEFTPSPCAPAKNCESFRPSNMPSAAFKFYGLPLDPDWIDQHGDAVVGAMSLACRRHATCLGTAGNTFAFCDDVLTAEVHPVCDKLFPSNTNRHEWDQCSAFRDTFLLGLDQRAEALWKQQQDCAKNAAAPHQKPLDLWMSPPTLPVEFSGQVKFFALDPDTHVPVLARITFENQRVYAPANPVGNPASFYPIDYTLKYARVPNAEGHTDVVPPTIVVTTPAYPEVAGAPPYPVMKFRLSAEVPKLVVEMKPAPEKLRGGKNSVIISARDAATGKPVEMRVVVGNDQIGNTNTPITVEVRRSGHHPEIWLTSLFDKYSDVVVARGR